MSAVAGRKLQSAVTLDMLFEDEELVSVFKLYVASTSDPFSLW